ncbi:hypothetical protein WICMUC_005146 [Wickerhamomyces mucosus]|uniref:Mitochondrial import receptor subunit TOM70 n=1 Tax=Wickerhamomyces mucosus TaxID=1378264 RepID=A0A9P8P987_9ASCO|nr:hypothetical protein WICMUC_005146 [Wickerhamomyces mucosus]
MSEFIKKNKVAIIATVSTLGVVAGSYYYYQQQQQQQKQSDLKTDSKSDTKSDSKSNKKSKKSNKKSKSSSLDNKVEKLEQNQYPIDSNGFPNLTKEFIDSLNDVQRDEISLILKEDGNKFFKDKKFEEAIKFYSSALDLIQSEIFYSNRSACYVGLENYEKVIEDTTSALKIKPDYTKCLLRRSNAFEKLEKFEDSMFDLTALTLYGGFNNQSLEQTLDRVLKKHSLKKVEENISKSIHRLPSPTNIGSFFGAFDEEIEIEFINVDDESNGDYFLQNGLNQLKLKTNEGYELADSYFNQAIEKYNQIDDETYRNNKAIAYEYSGIFKFLKADAAGALESIEKSIEIKPRGRSYVFRALIYADKQDFKEAENSFVKAIEISPNSSENYYHRAQLYYLTNQLDKARENFAKAQELNPQNVYSYIQLACIEYRNGEINKAEELFQNAKNKFPINPEIPNYYGEILSDKGDFTQALKQFDIANKLQDALLPKISVGVLPLINKAAILSKSGQNIKESIELLEKAIDLDPKSELAKITLAQLYLQTNEIEKAVVLFEDAADLSRNFEEKLQATSFAEASKIQIRVKNDPILSKKVHEILAQYGAQNL